MKDLVTLMMEHPAFLSGSQDTFKALLYDYTYVMADFAFENSKNKEAVTSIMLRAVDDAVAHQRYKCKAALQQNKTNKISEEKEENNE